MAVIKQHVVRGGIASLVLHLSDRDNGFGVIADTLPTVDVYDPLGTTIVSGAEAELLGSGEYVYNHPTTSTSRIGNYRAVFHYVVEEEEFRDDCVFMVI